MRALALLVVVGVVFSGCVASDAKVANDPADPAVAPPPSDTEGQIRGTVTDDALTPIAGAQIGILNSDPQVVVTTNAAGQFTLVGLVPGTYAVAAQSLGHESATRSVEVLAGQVTDISFVLTEVAVRGEARYQTLIGQGYFACGAYLVVTSWGNLDVCVWDDHQPRFEFEAPKEGLVAILQEVIWTQSTGLTAQELQVYLEYKPVCDPFCDSEKTFASSSGSSPIRNYVDVEGELDDMEEDPVPLASMTFPDGHDTPVIVFQQRMTHYITLIWGDHLPESFTAIPDG
jgi:hypothetical protein